MKKQRTRPAGPLVPAAPLDVYLVCHAESSSNGENRIQGHSDSGLTERGLRQARKAGLRLRKAGLRRIYSSDLGRAHKTAQAIAAACGLRVTADRGLREIRLGAWEGLTPEEVNRRHDGGYRKWLRSPSRMKIPGAETVAAFHRRIRSRVKKILESAGPGPVAIVTHGGAIASLLSDWLGADFDSVLLGLRVDNTSITVLEKRPGRIKIHRLADVSHLGPRDLTSKNIFSGR